MRGLYKNNFRLLFLYTAATILALTMSARFAESATVYDETIDGDLSNNPGNPTSIVLGLDNNQVIGSTIHADPDLLHFNMPLGVRLDSLILESFTSDDNLGFIGIQSGSIWSAGLGGTINPDNLLGWTHYGWGNGTVGTDILDELGLGAGAVGFTPPLLHGDYTILIQQTGSWDSIDYTFNFATNVPLPTSAWMGIILLVSVGTIRVIRQRMRWLV